VCSSDLLREHGSDGVTLVTYVQPRPGRLPKEDEIQAYLKLQLPSVRLGSRVIVVNEFHRTATGEIDYARLSALEPAAVATHTFVAPETTTQKLLAEIWCDVIGLEKAGIHDNFFDLGGHSVLITQVATRIRNAFDLELGLRVLFEEPTIAQLAETVEGMLMAEIDGLSEEEAQTLAVEAGGLAEKLA